jgi:signal transduction histidine kinase
MKPAKPGSHKQRIVLYYTLAVVLPGFILGYLAYRGIRNDQALREKENLKKLEMNSRIFFSAIDSSFVKFININTSDSVLSGFREVDSSLLALIFRDPRGSIKLIKHKLLYLPSDLINIKPEETSQATSLNYGIQLEFTEHRYMEALRFYQDKACKTTDRIEKIQALVASARLYNKMSQPDKANGMYDLIRKDYSGVLLNGQIPLALTASLEILKINKALGENDEMRKNSWRYLELLLHPACEYTRDQFEMFYQSFKEIVSNDDPLTDSLRSEIDNQKMRTENLIRILNQPEIISGNSENHTKNGETERSIIPISFGEFSAICLSNIRHDGKEIGLVVDFTRYLRSASEYLIKRLDKDSSVNLKVQDDYGELILSRISGEGKGYLSFPFPENLPRWKLLLSENKPGLMATLFRTGSGIYLFVFILIALFMLLGFAFIMYTLNVELRLNKLKSEFISNVSHELKSPLTSIRMMTEMLHHNRVQTEVRKSSYYMAMLEESEHLSHLIDNILDFSRMEDDRKKYELTDMDMDELISKFIESTLKSLPDNSFDIRYICPEKVPVIKADKDSILQVLYNLVDNAIKFSGKSRQIDISLSYGDNEILICVKDYGIGIPFRDKEKIFDRFYRSEESQRMRIRGSGIGLTIVKKITEAHGGTIDIESEVGKGSLFTVRIPLDGK